MTAKRVAQGLIVTMALCLISTTTGRAEDYRFFVMGGGSSLRDQRSFTEYYISYGSKYAGGGKVTVGIEKPLTKIFGVEGSIGYGRNNLELTYYNYSPVQVKGYGVGNDRFSGDIVARAPGVWKGVRPYAVMGVEYDIFSPTSGGQSVAKSQGFAGGPTATLSSQASRALTMVAGSITKWLRRSTCGSTCAITGPAPPPTACPVPPPRPSPPSFRSVGRRITSNTP